MREVDISIVLNCHDEVTYVMTTLRSLNCAVEEATTKGLTVEIVVVLDTAPELLKNIVNSFEFVSSAQLKIIEVNNRSLGLSRNSGIETASGKYVILTDADDLMSSNTLWTSYYQAEDYKKKNGYNACFIPEYVCSFGRFNWIDKCYPSSYFSPCDIVAFHPFTSRIFIARELAKSYMFKDFRKDSGAAFEDWEFNSRLYKDGVEITPAKGTVIFYRQRQGSIMASSDYVRTPLLAELLTPEIFLKLYQGYSRPAVPHESISVEDREKIKADIHQACDIDASIDAAELNQCLNSLARNTDVIYGHWGYRLPLLLNLVGASKYDDVFLLPWLNPGGGEKYILQVIDAITRLNSERKILVITLEETRKNSWAHLLPENVLIVNFERVAGDLIEEEKQKLLFSFLVSIKGRDANLFIKSGIFANNFFGNYKIALSKLYKVQKFLFCITHDVCDGRLAKSAFELEIIRNELLFVDNFISDNYGLAKYLIKYFGDFTKKKFSANVYAYVDGVKSVNKDAIKQRSGGIRLLWASRICNQKRCNLLNLLSNKLNELKLPVVIDVYGHDEGTIKINYSENLTYKGEFSSIEELDLSRYQGFLYTTLYDGIPNILLEMMAMGIPVIAPVGVGNSIGELIGVDNGWSVDQTADDEELVNRYVAQILAVLEQPEEAVKRALNAVEYIEKYHSMNHFVETIENIFHYKVLGCTEGKCANMRDIAYSQMLSYPKSLFIDEPMHLQHAKLGVTRKEFLEQFELLEEKQHLKSDLKSNIKKILSRSDFLYRISKSLWKNERVRKVYLIAEKLFNRYR